MRLFAYFFVIFYSLCTLAYGQNILGFHLTGNAKKADIPFENYNNLILIKLTLNKKIPLTFIVDTGVRTAILADKTYGDLININYTRKVGLLGADGKTTVEALVATNVSLDLQGVESTNQTMLVLEEQHLSLRDNMGIDVHGIIGYELFNRFVVKINYEKKVLTLYEPKYFKPKKSYTSIPISVENFKPYLNAFFTMTAKGKTKKAKLMIDTGASYSTSLFLASDSSITKPKKTIDALIGRALGGDVTGQIGRMHSLQIGSFEFNNSLVSLIDSMSYHDIIRKTNRNGSLGGEILSRFTTIFDYPNQKIYLRKNKSFKKNFNFNMSGLSVLARGPLLEKFVVVDVRHDSPSSEADIQVGDVIEAINSYQTKDLNLNLINALFVQKEGKKITMILKRNGTTIKRKFRLKALI